MKKLIIETENMDDMLIVVDLVRDKIGNEIKYIEVLEDELKEVEG